MSVAPAPAPAPDATTELGADYQPGDWVEDVNDATKIGQVKAVKLDEDTSSPKYELHCPNGDSYTTREVLQKDLKLHVPKIFDRVRAHFALRAFPH